MLKILPIPTQLTFRYIFQLDNFQSLSPSKFCVRFAQIYKLIQFYDLISAQVVESCSFAPNLKKVLLRKTRTQKKRSPKYVKFAVPHAVELSVLFEHRK